MSFENLYIRDVEGERRIDSANLPLRVGTGTDCQLRLPGPGAGPVLLLDLLDGAPFVQPFGRSDSIQINGEPLATSTRLGDGEPLPFGELFAKGDPRGKLIATFLALLLF